MDDTSEAFFRSVGQTAMMILSWYRYLNQNVGIPQQNIIYIRSDDIYERFLKSCHSHKNLNIQGEIERLRSISK